MSRPVTTLDIETRSAVDLKKVGAYRYAEDPSTEIIACSYRVGDGPIVRGFDKPEGILLAHNAGFERALLNAKLGWNLTPEDMDCTMARALAAGLPASLERCGSALKAPIQKDKDGRRLMLKMCRPRKVHDDGRIEWRDDPGDHERLRSYCDQDVSSECAIDARLPPLSPRERAVWVLDQTINDRGVRVDVPGVHAALLAVDEAKRRSDYLVLGLTNGAVTACTQTAKIVTWINGRGIPCESIAKGEVDELVLRADLFDDPLVEEVVRLRRAAARSSTAKYQAILDTVCKDGRVRGTLAYHGAHTGRWAGRLIQPQNFPRVDSQENVEAALGLLASAKSPSEAVDLIDLTVGPPMEVLSQCLRAMIVAPPGKKLVGGDFANIEGRVNAWFAGERWKLDAFRAYDEGVGADLYRLAYARSFGLQPEAVDSAGRQIGKVMELALGYQGGVGAFQTMARVYGVSVPDSRADALKRAWRDANPLITQSWWDLQNAAIAAVDSRGLVVPVLEDRIRYVSDGKFLYCRLPSGRVLHYASPIVRWKKRTVTVDGEEVDLPPARGVTYFGVNSLTKKWGPIDLYGGSQCDHIVQGTARDLLVEAMFRVEKAGYPIVLTVHDEILSEVDEGFGSSDEFAELMAVLPPWAEGLPVSVKVWEHRRWIK